MTEKKAQEKIEGAELGIAPEVLRDIRLTAELMRKGDMEAAKKSKGWPITVGLFAQLKSIKAQMESMKPRLKGMKAQLKNMKAELESMEKKNPRLKSIAKRKK